MTTKRSKAKSKAGAKSTRGAGRPSKLDTLDLEQVKKLYQKGWTDKEVADFYSVTEQTINNWKHANRQFFESIKTAKREADELVKAALFQRATGYKCIDTKFATFEGRITDQQEYIKHYAPDPTAIIFWLCNRDPENWRRSPEAEGGSGPEFPRAQFVRGPEIKRKKRGGDE